MPSLIQQMTRTNPTHKHQTLLLSLSPLEEGPHTPHTGRGSLCGGKSVVYKSAPPYGGVSYRVAVAERSPVAGGVGRGGRGERVLGAARRSASSTVKWC